MSETVTKDTCDKSMSDLQRQVTENARVAEKRLDAHAGQIDRVDKLMERVITLQEIQTKQLEASENRLQLLEKQVAEMERAKREDTKQEIRTEQKKEPFWKEKWFFFIVITLCIIFVIIVGAAVGQNIMKEYMEYLKTVK